MLTKFSLPLLLSMAMSAMAAESDPSETKATREEDKTPPPFLTAHLERNYGAYLKDLTLLDFDWGDLDGDDNDELVALFRNGFTVAPSAATRGKSETHYQTWIAVFVPEDGEMAFADDIRVRWCEAKNCRSLKILDSGEIVIRKVRKIRGEVQRNSLKLRYEEQKFKAVNAE